MNRLNQLYLKLNQLENQKRTIEKEIKEIRYEISTLFPMTKEQKIELFRSLFIGREDVYAKHWTSKDGTKSGYSPVTYTFRGNDYCPINNKVIQLHLEGKIRIGTYVVFDQIKTKFLVFDLDKKSYIDDMRAIVKVCKSLELDPIVEISKSGNGVHIWLFFKTPVNAKDARRLGDLILTHAMDVADGIDMQSYDRMFPNQDFVEVGSLGNLIALPLHYKSRIQNKTVFVDISSLEPYPNQWEVLQNVKKITTHQLEKIFNNYCINIFEESLMPWEFKRKLLHLPKSIQIVMYDGIYIEREHLSKAVLNELIRFASFYNPEYFILQKLRKSTYKTPRIISLYEINDRYLILPRGLYRKVKDFFNSYNCRILLEDRRFLKKTHEFKISIKLKKEQIKAVSTILNKDYALLIASPGFGKTVVAAAIIAKRMVNTLVLVHKTTLLEQWIERLSQYFGIEKSSIGTLGKGKKQLNGILDVAMIQSIKNRTEIIKEYSQVIIDEAHHIPAVTFEIPLKHFCGKYILGLSATPIRKDGMHHVMFMQCGEIAYRVDKKNSSSHKLKTIATKFETIEDDFASILNELAICEDRNRLIIDQIINHKNRNILLLSERIEHLNILYHLLQVKNIDAILLHGALSQKLQKEMKQKALNSNLILSTTSYFGEGIDLPHLDTIFLTMPISYKERLIQYLGRIGRDGQSCVAVDFVDENVPMLKASFKKRLSGYKRMNYLDVESFSLFD